MKMIPFNDRMRWELAGQPERCLICGKPLKHTVSHPVSTVTLNGQRVRVAREKHQYICPDYGRSASPPPYTPQLLRRPGMELPSLHECFLFFDDEPGLAPFLSYRVGSAGPAARTALYTTVIFAALLIFMFIVTKVLG